MSARVVAFELHRTWREGWDVPGSSGYDSYIMAHRNMRELFPDHVGSMVELAKEILAEPIPHDISGEIPVVQRPCTCNGMGFICNRWVFTGECSCGAR